MLVFYLKFMKTHKMLTQMKMQTLQSFLLINSTKQDNILKVPYLKWQTFGIFIIPE